MNSSFADAHSLRWTRAGLVCLAVISFGLVTTVNRAAGRLFFKWPWLPDTCIASFFVCLAIYLGIRPTRPFAAPSPTTNWLRIWRVAIVWLGIWFLASAVMALAAGHWVRYGPSYGTPQRVGFLAFGPLQEELLFRGAIYELAERRWPGRGAWIPILVTAGLFSLHHLQPHHYPLTKGALLQMAFTFPMGVVFGILRAESQSIWPGLEAHLFTNLPGAFGS